MHQALYRKWRPSTFDDVCGQEHITSILKYECEHGKFSHAYLFCGSRGTGKTTCAKILAKAVNCESPQNGSPCGKCASCISIDSGVATDVLEMDAASNNGVENIRDIRDEVVYAPSNLKKRVYIVDEVHMLSASAFNALLKTLEEPPEYVVFILATTELHKLPATIVSRCQRFDFRRISTPTLMQRLKFIAEQEGIDIEEDAARAIAKIAQGGMRDAISLLELCAGSRKTITTELVSETVGSGGRENMMRLVEAIADKDFDMIFEEIDQTVRSSKDLLVFWQDLISLYRDILVVRTVKDSAKYLDLTDAEKQSLDSVARKFSKEALLYHCKLLEDALYSMQKANAVKRIVAEMTLVRMCDNSLDTSNEALSSRIAEIEDRFYSGFVTTPSSVSKNASLDKKEESNGKDTPSQNDTNSSDKNNAKTSATQTAKNDKSESGERSASQSQDSDKRVLKLLRCWPEVVERASRGDAGVGAFLKNMKAYTSDDGKVFVCAENSFVLGMIERGDTKDKLRAAISANLRREVSDRDIIYEVTERVRENSVMDEIDELMRSAHDGVSLD